jgi:hypothetical protein
MIRAVHIVLFNQWKIKRKNVSQLTLVQRCRNPESFSFFEEKGPKNTQ